jgi:(R,R)-butanediol dehydrogenase/meso-butanediol dehydrogenase/diacetyl reductase
MPMIRCGRCRACLRGDYELCESYACTGLTSPWGGFATRAVIREYQALPLPGSVSDNEGALLEPAAVAMTAVRRAKINPGDTVLVTGGGPIGAFAALLARVAGAGSVTISEPNPTRRAVLEERSIGDFRLDPLTNDVGAIARDRTAGYGVDIAIECSGQPQALNAAVDATRHGGAIVQVGLFTGVATISPFDWCNKNLRVEAMVNHHPASWGALIDLIANRRVDLSRIVTSRSDLNAAAAGFERLLDPSGADIKILVDIGD